jgi:hypothetical protein
MGVLVIDDDGGAESRAEDEALRHDDARDASDEKDDGKHGGNLTRLAALAWG